MPAARLTGTEESMLSGTEGEAVQKSMEILVALGEIYEAKRLVPIGSAQIAGVSYHNLGEAGLEYLEALASMGAKVRVASTLNPAGMDMQDWRSLGITDEFAQKQLRLVQAFISMGVKPTLTCTPYLVGNLPSADQHIAWSESSAVTYANSVLGAMTNREGGPSALAAAITGRTAEYGMHLKSEREPQVRVNVDAEVKNIPSFGALGKAIGEKIGNKIPQIFGVKAASQEELKTFSASIATYGGTSLFYMHGVTREPSRIPSDSSMIEAVDIQGAIDSLNDPDENVDFVSVGCPHCSIQEVERLAIALGGKTLKSELWIAISREVKDEADKLGYSQIIQNAGAKFACDTCMAVAPLRGRFTVMATDSAKACYYARGSNGFKTRFGSLDQCTEAAVTGKWRP